VALGVDEPAVVERVEQLVEIAVHIADDVQRAGARLLVVGDHRKIPDGRGVLRRVLLAFPSRGCLAYGYGDEPCVGQHGLVARRNGLRRNRRIPAVSRTSHGSLTGPLSH